MNDEAVVSPLTVTFIDFPVNVLNPPATHSSLAIANGRTTPDQKQKLECSVCIKITGGRWTAWCYGVCRYQDPQRTPSERRQLDWATRAEMWI